MIKAQVSWWPGNVETKGGTHVHHLVWGILLLLAMGYLGITTDIGSPWLELVAVVFGIGMGLTMDEFALWLNLEDVYWEKKGRQSIDAVIVTISLLLVALLGLAFWIDVYDAVLVLAGLGSDSSWIAIPVQLVGVAFAIVCFRRGRKLAGLFGLFVPLVAIIGALAAKPPTGAFHRLITRVSRSWPSTERVPVSSATSAPASGPEADPARGHHPQHVAVGEDHRVAVEPVEAREHPVDAPADVGRRLAAGAAVAPQVPVRAAARGSAAVVMPSYSP